ncbi:hypothetical protein EDB95_0326 [Dinghuibacter silviterrae]|uniref:Uncharacterized protein n=1 Tax=Dinghuibacter silviterrae TaxID=1539049 RepID=A0A4R8DNN6_9BACT|nr:hypothetical protein EDB95_0326 [Dinghuibacter silviterrae]
MQNIISNSTYPKVVSFASTLAWKYFQKNFEVIIYFLLLQTTYHGINL